MPRPRPGNRCGLMAPSRTILLLRAYVANASIATIAFCSSVIATNKKSKAYMRRPRDARNQRVTVRPKMAHISNLKAASACFQRKRDFSNSKSRARRKEREAWYIVFSGIEGPHTIMTVRTRLARTTAVKGVFPSQNLPSVITCCKIRI
jgi:hypothetical protein